MTQKAKIHVIGSYAVGMTMRTACFPKEGETIPGYNFTQLHGGKGSNQAVGAARMNADVMFTSCIGEDMLGDAALSMLGSEGIRTESVFRSSQSSTGVGFVMVGDNGENEILIDLGANEDLSREHIDQSFNLGFDADILLVQLEANLDAVYYAMKLAQKKGIPSVLNPAPFREIPEEFIRLATYIVPNQTESESLLKHNGVSYDLCLELHNKYGVDVILTAGKDGAFYTDTDTDSMETVIKNLKVDKVPVIDTTGAGDCFNAALAVALAENKSISEAVLLANTSASLSVQVEGVLESLPDREKVESKLMKSENAACINLLK
ncbi:MAG: ribokinase [Spirochaetia bacterium]|nr:ribokinase [Spirochaetia bacterium]MCF7945550.1 ribokinase [Spirochaetia bacterium]MCF7946878.1 ribokinase [Spirochaetia bacterium]